MLISIHHIAIICSDKERALHFYSNLLGFPVIRSNYRPDRNDWKIDLLLSGDINGPHTELELFIAPSAPSRPSYPEAQGLRHLAFRVPTVAGAVAWLHERGIECEPVRQDTYTGEAMTFFHDPDGLPIEIHETRTSELPMPPKIQDNTPEEQKARDWADAIPDDAEQSDDYVPTYYDGSQKNECWNDSAWRDD